MLIAGIQQVVKNGDFRFNLEHVLPLYAEAAKKGARVIVLQEFWGVGFKVRPMDKSVVAKCTQQLEIIAQICRDTNTYCIAGSLPRLNKQDQVSNTMVVIDPSGNNMAEYEKVNLFRPYDEHLTFAAGEQPKEITIDGVKIALTICFDLRFPELFLAHREKGAQLFVVPAQWPEKRITHWETLLRARAIDTQCYVLGVNRGGRDTDETWGCRSQFIDPWGTIQDRCESDEGIVYGKVDIPKLEAIRANLPVWACRAKPES